MLRVESGEKQKGRLYDFMCCCQELFMRMRLMDFEAGASDTWACKCLLSIITFCTLL